MLGVLLAAQLAAAAPGDVRLAAPPNDDGRHIVVSFDAAGDPAVTGYEILRTTTPVGPALAEEAWTRVTTVDGRPGRLAYTDEVPDGDAAYSYAVRALAKDGPRGMVVVGPARPVAAWFDTRRTFLLAVVLGMLVAMMVYLRRARRAPRAMYVRRIPGIDAMEEAIGRSTEMGRPVLYIPGIEEIQDIQTVAGLLVLGHVAEVAARYETEIRVACMFPLVMVIAEEIVQQGYANAGRPEAHRPQNVQFISSEQFAFAAAVNGIIMREKPATNLFLGRFFAEALILAEAGFANGSIQIAGTAELSQLPFFIAACDYTIIGEELFAVSAYLSRDPRELSGLKATDLVKAVVVLLVVTGALLNTFGVWDLASWIAPPS
jgi:hypothetical protein